MARVVSVVYLLIPTSNHNHNSFTGEKGELYIFWFLHQTTTFRYNGEEIVKLYIFWFLHQTTTLREQGGCPCGLYIFWFLHQTTTYTKVGDYITELYIFWFIHQTTTRCNRQKWRLRCISFDSYIKPQQGRVAVVVHAVVYLLIPTSNHNRWRADLYSCELYIFWFLHQTTTDSSKRMHDAMLYIFWFLHQTTTTRCWRASRTRCISFDSYIKPQLLMFWTRKPCRCISFDSYIKPQLALINSFSEIVVYLLIPTSNHNL